MAFPTDIDLRAQALQLCREGASLIGQGRADEARLALKQALALQSGLADVHHLLGQALQQMGQPQEALQAYRQALACDAGHLPAHLRLALLLEQLGRRDEAVGIYRRLLEIHPGAPEVHYGLATLLDDMGRHFEAEAAYRQALRLRPGDYDAHQALGASLAAQGRLAEAEDACRQALALRPGLAAAHLCLAELLARQSKVPEAEAHYRQAVALESGNARAHERLASVLHRQEKYAQAVEAYQRVLALDPDDADTWSNMGTALDFLNRLPQAEAAFRQSLALRPDDPDACFGLSLVLLRQGRLAEAWPLYEFRYHPDRHRRMGAWSTPRLDCPPWRGEPLQGKSLVIWQEQGHGDMIQFMRYLPRLRARGVRHVTVACREPLGPLFAAQPGVDAVVAFRKSATLDDVRRLLGHDYWVYEMSLPRALGATLDDIPPAAYLRPDPQRAAHWRARLAGLPPGPKVGLSWMGNARHSNDRNRSLPGLSTLAPLWRTPGVRFISVQKGQGESEARTPHPGLPLLHLGSDIRDFADSAALITQLDLLICVDTATAHVAGALGVPCWVLLPGEGTDWRWLLEGETTAWYPDTMRLFRQVRAGDWSDPVERLRQALATRYPGNSAAPPR